MREYDVRENRPSFGYGRARNQMLRSVFLILLFCKICSGSIAVGAEIDENYPEPPEISNEAGSAPPPRDLPFYKLTGSLSVLGRYDSNVAFVPNGGGDLLLLVSPEWRLSVSNPRTKFEASYMLSAEAYQSYPELNSLNRNQLATLDLAHRFTPRLGSRQTASAEFSSRPVFGQVSTGRLKYRTFEFESDWRYRLLPRLGFAPTYRFTGTDFSDPSLVDHSEHELRAGLDYRVSESTTILSAYRLRGFEFQDNSASRSQSIEVGLKQNLAPRWKMGFMLGRLKYESDSGRQRGGNTASVTLDGRWQGAALSLRYDRDLSVFVGSEGVAWSDTVTARLGNSPTEKVGSTGFGIEIQQRWQGENLDTSAQPFQVFWFQADLNHRLRPWLILQTAYSQLRQTTNGFSSDGSITDHRVTVGFSLTQTIKSSDG